ncbi:MAG: hypothetical protein JKX85_08980 [Phycisphaeraceae bacterium]|nr:hypothetical protein [Phycisphaeraceae bacterium]
MTSLVFAEVKTPTPKPFEDHASLLIFEAEPAPKEVDSTKPVPKASIAHPTAVTTENQHYSDVMHLYLVLKGYKPSTLTLDYAFKQPVKTGEYRWWAGLRLGGKALQVITIYAGPDVDHLTLRGKIRQTNKASWKHEWMAGKRPVHLDGKDQLLRVVITGSASDRKIIDAMVFEPLTP